jgi:ligand-binding sensor domain-containing protein
MGRFSLTLFFTAGILLSIQSFTGVNVHAQQVLGFHLSEANGLHTNYNFEIYQDSDGYMWFGGDNGIARYDGESFRYYSVDEGLPGNYTYAIFEDSRGIIWAGGYDGWLAKKSGEHFETVLAPGETQLNSVLDIIEDEKGNLIVKGSNALISFNPDSETYRTGDLHISLKGASLFKRENGEILVFDKLHLHKIRPLSDDSLQMEPVTITFSSSLKNDRLPNLSNTTMLETHDGDVYMVVSGVTFRGSWQGDSLILHEKFFHSNSNHAVFNHDTTGIFLGSVRDGLIELGLKTGEWQRIHLLVHEESFRVFNLLTDYENNVWVSTFSHGVFKLGENRITQYSTRSGLLSNTVNHISIYKDSYLLTHERELSFVNRKDFSHLYSYRNSQENRLTVPTKDGFYLGANYYISKVVGGRKNWKSAVTFQYSIDTTPSSIIDLGDSLLITTIGDDVLKYHNGIVTVMQGDMWEPLSIVEQAVATDKEIWFVTQSDGIYVFLREQKEMRKLSGLPTEMISYVEINGDRAWLGSRKGVIELRNDSVLQIHGAESGLYGRKIYHISDLGNAVWVVSDLGIHRFRNDKWILVQSFSDLFNRSPQIYHVISDTVYNRMLLGTNEGLVTIPLDREVSPKTVPKITIESLLFGDEQRFEQPGSLKPDSIKSYKRSVQIDYNVLSYTNSNEASYFYRLLPIQSEWKNEQGKQSVLFANLAPNDYRFQVKQIFPDGTETEVAEASFNVLPWFYETLFFRLIMSALGLCVLGLVIRFAVMRKEQKRRQREESKQFEMISLKLLAEW